MNRLTVTLMKIILVLFFALFSGITISELLMFSGFKMAVITCGFAALCTILLFDIVDSSIFPNRRLMHKLHLSHLLFIAVFYLSCFLSDHEFAGLLAIVLEYVLSLIHSRK